MRALKALQDQVSPLYFNAILVRNHARPKPMAVYLAGKFLLMEGRCLPIGYDKSASTGTHYKRDLVEFRNSSEIPAFLEEQDSAREKQKVENELKKLLGQLENIRGKNPRSGKLENDEQRRLVQSAR